MKFSEGERQELLKFFVLPKNAEFKKECSKALNNIVNLARVFDKIYFEFMFAFENVSDSLRLKLNSWLNNISFFEELRTLLSSELHGWNNYKNLKALKTLVIENQAFMTSVVMEYFSLTNIFFEEELPLAVTGSSDFF